MFSYWNSRELIMPPVCNMKVILTETAADKLKDVRTVLSDCWSCLEEQSALMSEIFVLSRLIYKRNGQLRQHKYLQTLKQVDRCLKRFAEVDLKSVVQRVQAGFMGVNLEPSIQLYLPSRQMMEHLLTRLVGVAVLMAQTINFAGSAFVLLHQQLHTGNLIPPTLLFVGLVSRIWAICRSLYTHCESWYAGLLPAVEILSPTYVTWLPEEESLPQCLKEFVNSKVEEEMFQSISADNLTSILEQMIRKEGDDTTDDNYNSICDEAESKLNDADSVRIVLEEDIGAPVKIHQLDRTTEEDHGHASRSEWQVTERKQELLWFAGFLQSMINAVKMAKSFKTLSFIMKKVKKKSHSIAESGKDNTAFQDSEELGNCINSLYQLQVKNDAEEINSQPATKNLKQGKRIVLKYIDKLHFRIHSLQLTYVVLTRQELMRIIKELKNNSQFEFGGTTVIVDLETGKSLRQTLKMYRQKLRSLKCGTLRKRKKKKSELLDKAAKALVAAAESIWRQHSVRVGIQNVPPKQIKMPKSKEQKSLYQKKVSKKRRNIGQNQVSRKKKSKMK